MPNWVTTKIEFTGEKNDIKKVLETIINENGDFDFNTLIPMPDNIYTGNLGQAEREKYGANNWYDWSCENWGTKWNACHSCLTSCLEFDTAWSLAEPVLQALAVLCHNTNVEFEGYFCDEDWSYNKGGFYSKDGICYIWYDDNTDIKDPTVKDILCNVYGEFCYEEMVSWEEEYNNEGDYGD